MYGFPSDLDLSAAIGQETTQFCVGPYDLQFSFGKVAFTVQSRVELKREGIVVGIWEGGGWPSDGFYDAFCSPIASCQVVDEKRLCIALENGIELHLLDTSSQYECLQIYVPDEKGPYII